MPLPLGLSPPFLWILETPLLGCSNTFQHPTLHIESNRNTGKPNGIMGQAGNSITPTHELASESLLAVDLHMVSIRTTSCSQLLFMHIKRLDVLHITHGCFILSYTFCWRLSGWLSKKLFLPVWLEHLPGNCGPLFEVRLERGATLDYSRAVTGKRGSSINHSFENTVVKLLVKLEEKSRK